MGLERVHEAVNCVFNYVLNLLGNTDIRHHSISGDEASCSVCMGSFLVEADRLQCTCGACYHPACASISGECVRCALPLRSEPSLFFCSWLPKYVALPLNIYRCMYCNEEVSQREQFCHSCGSFMSTVEGFLCPVCSSEISSSEGYCKCCGISLHADRTNVFHCPDCLQYHSADGGVCGLHLPSVKCLTKKMF